MSKELQKAPIFVTRAAIDSTTYNTDNCTVEVTFATDARVWMGGYYETLSFKPEHVRMQRLNSRANILDNHRRGEKLREGAVLGVVEWAKLEGNQGRALVRFSKRAELESFRKDVADGILCNVSCGYRIYEYQLIGGGQGTPEDYLAVDWEPMEISFTDVPGDYQSQTRSAAGETADLSQIKISPSPTNNQRSAMPEKTESPENKTVEPGAPALVDQNRNAAPAPVVPPADAVRTALVAERQRSADIYEAVRLAGLAPEFAANLVTNGTPTDAARQAVIAEFAKGDVHTRAGNSGVQVDEADKRRSAIEGALLHRAAPGEYKLENGANEFRGVTLIDAARTALVGAGVKVSGMTASEIATRSLGTSDFPALLANIANKFLMKAYTEAVQTWRPLATQLSAVDFKAITGIQFGGSTQLEEVKEGGEYKTAVMKESAESFSLKTYGKVISINRQAIINDDLNGFTRVAALFGNAASNLESDLMWGKITTNPAMGDKKTLFHADHKNLTTGGLDESGLSAARVSMMRQTGLSNEKLNLTPKFLVVPPELLTTAEKLVSTVQSTKTSDVNVFAQRLTIICDQRLTDTFEWYVTAAPAQIDMLVYSYLNGQSGLYTESQVDFDSDALKIKARLDFGGGIFDYRGFLKSTGK